MEIRMKIALTALAGLLACSSGLAQAGQAAPGPLRAAEEVTAA
jgi:hypothetical protein